MGLPRNFALVAFNGTRTLCTRTSCFPFMAKLLSSRIPLLTRTAGYANQHAGELGNGRMTWDVFGVFDDGAFFSRTGWRSGGAVSGFLTMGSCRIFGILDMNGIRAAYRAVKIPPPLILGGPSSTDECEGEAPEPPHVCPERQLLAQQTHKHGYRHPPGIVTVTNTCVWCRNIYRDRRATCLNHQHSWKRGYCTGRGGHLHTVVIPVNTTCSLCDQHFESVAMLLEHLRTEFPLDQRNAELGLDGGAGNSGGEATETEAPSRRTGATEPRHTEANAANSIPAWPCNTIWRSASCRRPPSARYL